METTGHKASRVFGLPSESFPLFLGSQLNLPIWALLLLAEGSSQVYGCSRTGGCLGCYGRVTILDTKRPILFSFPIMTQ